MTLLVQKREHKKRASKHKQTQTHVNVLGAEGQNINTLKGYMIVYGAGEPWQLSCSVYPTTLASGCTAINQLQYAHVDVCTGQEKTNKYSSYLRMCFFIHLSS